MLESRLAGTLERLDEVLAQRKTLEQISKRLREERTGLDPQVRAAAGSAVAPLGADPSCAHQLQALERTLAAKSRDLEDLVRVSHEAAHAKDAAKLELLNVEEQLSADRKLREKQLSDRAALWRMKQFTVPTTAAALLLAPPDAALASGGPEELASAASVCSASASAEEYRAMSDPGGMSLSAGLQKIKEVTGVADVDSVIKKFSSQKDTAKNLACMTQEAQARIDALVARIDAAKTGMEKLRYSGAAPSGAAGAGTRRALDGLEVHLVDALAQHERLRMRQERVARLMVAVRAGADHLAEQLESVLPAPSSSAERATGDVEFSLSICRSKLCQALHELRDVAAASRTSLSDPAQLESLASQSVEESGALLPLLLPENLPLCEAEDEAEEKGEEAEVTSRAALKQRSAERRVSASKKERARW